VKKTKGYIGTKRVSYTKMLLLIIVSGVVKLDEIQKIKKKKRKKK